MRIVTLCVAVLVTAQQVVAEPKDELELPVNVVVDGKPLDTGGVGYASPFFGDFDGDSVRDLLVGEFAQGRLRIYRNLGTNQQPKFDSFVWFQDGAETGRVPTG